MAGIGYRPEIDGLRAFAVIPVILFHMGLSWVPGGFIGVDVFFVISGFLITSIIKKELARGTFSFRDFWARRVRRILPAMIFVTACTLAVTYFFVFRPEQQPIGKQALAALFSVANIYFWRSTGDYWGTAAEESPFLHAWSLSVEEQFYLFFPVAMWLIFRFRSRSLQTCILTAAVASLALFLWGSQTHPTATFYLLPTRVWELGTGCLLAVSLSDQSPKNSTSGVFAIAGLGMVVLSHLFFDTLNAGLGLAVVGTALIIAFGQTGLCKTLLSQRPVVHIGKISYSLYLWHWPVLVLAKHRGLDWPGFTDKAFLLCATYVLAFGTYHLVEKPMRRRNGIVPPIIVSGTLVACAAFWMAWLPRQYDDSSFNKPVYFGAYYTLQPKRASDTVNERFGGWEIPTRSAPPNAYLNGGIIVGPTPAKPSIVVLGDSHGVMWSNTIRAIVEKHRITTSFYSANGASPFVQLPLRKDSGRRGGFGSDVERFQYDKARLDCIKRWQPDLVILCRAWSREKEEDAYDLMHFLEENASRVLLMEQPPLALEVDRKNFLQFLIWKGIKPKKGIRQYWPTGKWDNDDVARGRTIVQRLVKKYDKCGLIPVHDVYYNEKQTLALDGFDVIYLDFMHLSEFGAQLSAYRIEHAILNVFAEGSHGPENQ